MGIEEVPMFLQIGDVRLPLTIVEQRGIIHIAAGEEAIIPERIEIMLTRADQDRIRDAITNRKS